MLPPTRRPLAFTLIELLVVIAIIALLISILLPALGQARECVRGVRDAHAARELMVAYTMHADDHDGRLLVAYPSDKMLEDAYARGDVARDFAGDVLPIDIPAKREIVKRYPWRLISYLDNNIEGLYQDPRVAAAVFGATDSTLGDAITPYAISLYPSFGLNGFFVGGSDRDTKVLSTPTYKKLFGEFWLTRMTQPRNPSHQLVFAGSRYLDTANILGAGVNTTVQGFFEVRPPWEFEVKGRQWDEEYDPNSETPGINSGAVSLRYNSRTAIGVLDGHAEQLDWAELNDMRWWSDRAENADWSLKPLGS